LNCADSFKISLSTKPKNKMAQVNDNDLTLGLRGKFGKQFIFRKHGKKTIAVRRFAPSGAKTDAQIDHREKFRLATLYAKRSLLQPALKAEYEAIARAKESASAFAAAVGDYLSPVAIDTVHTATYHGEIGFPIGVVLNDVYKVKTIKVTLVNSSGAVVESGPATRAEGASGYTYTTTVAVPDISGLTIKVEVTDRPGNIVTEEVIL
jgi:hypothetical protein